MRIYSDLDNTLIYPITDRDGYVTAILPRPGVGEFLKKLSSEGELWMLTAAQKGHAERALSVLWPHSKAFKGVITIENMEPIFEQVNVIFREPGLSDEQRWDLWSEIPPLFPSGVVFDDYPADSGMFALKAGAVGIDRDRWVKVDFFGENHPDNGGLRKAYSDFKKRFPAYSRMSGRRRA